jgi:hypothetical protein
MFILVEMKEAFNDWLNLLQGPNEPYFALNSSFADGAKYLFRLIPLVLVMICAVLTFSYLGLTTSQQQEIFTSFWKDAMGQARYALIIFLMGALFAALYRLIARMFKIKIEFKQIFFIFLLLLLPWIPIVMMVNVLGYIFPDLLLLPIFIILFIYLIFPLVFVFQFGRGIAVVSGCSRLRCLASVLIPFVLIAGLVLLVNLSAPALDQPPEASFSRNPG